MSRLVHTILLLKASKRAVERFEIFLDGGINILKELSRKLSVTSCMIQNRGSAL